MTELGAYLKLSGNPRLFDKQKSTHARSTTARSSVAYFSFAVSSDVDPCEIMARVNVDWNMQGGTRLSVKSLGVFDTVTPMVIYFLWNEGHGPTLLGELQQILSQAAPASLGGEQAAIPSMALRKQIPRIPGQDTSDFNNLSFRAQMARRAWHIEVEKTQVGRLLKLVADAKAAGYITAMWGRQAHISESADNDTSPGELKRYVKFAQRHVNFHCSMTCDDLRGIVHLDATAPVFSVATEKKIGDLTLRHVLLTRFKLADGTSLIAEVHQRGTMGLVEVIVPNTPEAEAMILMMNRHFPAYCFHYLTSEGMDDAFVKQLIREACCPTLVSKIKECTWDPEKKSIITVEQAEEERRLQELESAAWYKDEFGKHLISKMNRLKTSYSDAEALYKLDGDRSVKTLHARNDQEEQSTTRKKKRQEEIVEVNSSSDSDFAGSSGTSSSNDDDTTMDSASNHDHDKSMDEAVADTGANLTVRFSPASSADASAPSPSAGGG
jgi:hypothetical protein